MRKPGLAGFIAILIAAAALTACSHASRISSGNATSHSDLAGANPNRPGTYPDSFASTHGPNNPLQRRLATDAGDTIYFATNSAEIPPEAARVLDTQAAWLRAHPGYPVTIEGHADERGTREYNLALGARRARAVRAYLAGRGVSARRLRTISYGKERPVALCDTPSCWSRNRRAFTTIEPSRAYAARGY